MAMASISDRGVKHVLMRLCHKGRVKHVTKGGKACRKRRYVKKEGICMSQRGIKHFTEGAEDVTKEVMSRRGIEHVTGGSDKPQKSREDWQESMQVGHGMQVGHVRQNNPREDWQESDENW